MSLVVGQGDAPGAALLLSHPGWLAALLLRGGIPVRILPVPGAARGAGSLALRLAVERVVYLHKLSILSTWKEKRWRGGKKKGFSFRSDRKVIQGPPAAGAVDMKKWRNCSSRASI